jgi:hypothetical protein
MRERTSCLWHDGERGIDFFGYRASRQDLELLDMALADYARRTRLKMQISSPVAVSISKNLRLFVELRAKLGIESFPTSFSSNWKQPTPTK